VITCTFAHCNSTNGKQSYLTGSFYYCHSLILKAFLPAVIERGNGIVEMKE